MMFAVVSFLIHPVRFTQDWRRSRAQFDRDGWLKGEREARIRELEYELVHSTREYEDMLGCISLYIKWRYVTTQLTTSQKELFANAVDAWSQRLDDGIEPWTPIADRWWRE